MESSQLINLVLAKMVPNAQGQLKKLFIYLFKNMKISIADFLEKVCFSIKKSL